jgi:hypothetical protein
MSATGLASVFLPTMNADAAAATCLALDPSFAVLADAAAAALLAPALLFPVLTRHDDAEQAN